MYFLKRHCRHGKNETRYLTKVPNYEAAPNSVSTSISQVSALQKLIKYRCILSPSLSKTFLCLSFICLRARPTFFRLLEFIDYNYNTDRGQEFWLWASLPTFRKRLPYSLLTNVQERIPLKRSCLAINNEGPKVHLEHLRVRASTSHTYKCY